jgi:hypothetical protein
MSTTSTTKHDPGEGEHLSILVGAPDPLLRARLASALRLQGHLVLEAADAQGMRQRLDENTERTGKPLDLILCGGLFAEKEDPELAQRLTSPGGTRALGLVIFEGDWVRRGICALDCSIREVLQLVTVIECMPGPVYQD